MANSKENTPTGSPSPSEENLSDKIRLAAKIDFAATISSAKKGREPPPSAPRRSRKSSSSDKPRSSKKSSSSEKILKLMENLVKPLADGFESMRAQQKKTQEQATYHQELERVNRRLDEVDSKVHRATSSAPELTKALADTRRSPLTRRLRQIELHERVRLKIDSYTGEEDPKKWLTAFNLAMRREKYKSYDEREANYCQVFVEHMAKDALTWFSNLPAESIDNFDDLTNAFLKHYSMHMTRITRNMFTTTQTQGEPLRSFMERFKQAARDTGDMPDSVPLEALRNGLWYDSKFKEDLSLKPPATLEDAFHRSRNYIFLEEDQRFYAEKHGDRRATSTKPREEPMEARKRYNPKRSLLTAFAAADNEPEQEPHHIKKRATDVATPISTTLTRFAASTEPHEYAAVEHDRNPTREEIPTIIFTDQDTAGLDTPHVDPLVVSLHISDSSVARILIDTGSTVNLIYKETLNRMEISRDQIKRSLYSLTGFTSEHVSSEGTIRLPIHVGGTTKAAEFFVIDKPAIYNAILGTPWLHEMKAVVSTFHQCVKFPAQSGIYTLRGNQGAARSCFLYERRLRLAATCTANEEMDPRLPYHQRPKPALVDEVNIDESSGKVRWHRWRPRRDKRATGHIAQTERAPFRMVNGRYERDRPGNHIPRAKRGLYLQTHETEKTQARRR
ncbi:unnamed protein product [Microthlaspi erraticum]|uniref:Retrotransposon gag domain-containing protein n=1 Tax=Microthlaspi erraticum TaxID=1685480 RepID=A0A6D2HP69_9BRAS|nr:unnamed protein product [Microthlaspi erraticum]